MKILSRLVASLLLALPVVSEAKELQYFENKIDFWGEIAPSSKTSLQAPIIIQPNEKGSFPWKTYLDPKNKEFFREGDYTPPEPFMEIARNPSDENIKNWFDFMKKKNELASRMQLRMQEYLTKNQASTPASPIGVGVANRGLKSSQPDVALDPSRFRIRMYFDSNCPHCKRMFAVLKRLQSEGYQVEALQVDSGPVPESERVVPLGKADSKELKKHGASGVPFLLVADMKRKALLPKVEGYHDYEDLIGMLKVASRN